MGLILGHFLKVNELTPNIYHTIFTTSIAEAFVKMAADKAKDDAIQALTHDLVTPVKTYIIAIHLYHCILF